MSEKAKVMEADILIIGSGAAGLRAAIESSKQDLKVALVTKGSMSRSGVSFLAVKSCCAACGHVDPRDSPRIHFEDTVKSGKLINNQRLVNIMTTEAIDRIKDLERYGMEWDRTNGKYSQSKYPGHTYARSLSQDHRTGLAMVNALTKEVRKRKNVRCIDSFFITNLTTSPNNEVIGGMGIDVQTGIFNVCLAKSTIIATGGAMEVYSNSSGTCECTGDGYAMSYRVGAELMDMEFVQFIPVVTYFPESIKGTSGPGTILHTLKARLYNSSHERFMSEYSPKYMELDTRDVVARGIYREIREGRATPHGGVWLDCTFLPSEKIEYIVSKVYGGWTFLGVNMLDYGLDIRKVAVEVGPAAHHFMGGIRVNDKWAANIPGLYAAGEVVGGLHGANRLAGNALIDTQVSGAIAGKNAAEHARNIAVPNLNEKDVDKEKERILKIFERKTEENVAKVRGKIQNSMWERVGIIRSAGSLKRTLKQLKKMRNQLIPKLSPTTRSKRYNRELMEVLEVENILDVAEMITRAALLRNESRGAHYREDFPFTENKWLGNIVIVREGRKMKLVVAPVVYM